MAHLGMIQQRLNTDSNYRKRFLKDPVAALAEQGLFLNVEMQTQLRQVVAQSGNRSAFTIVPAAATSAWSGSGGGALLNGTRLFLELSFTY